MTVIQVKFRKAVPPLDGVAKTGEGGGICDALPTSHPRYDAHADGFHASESFAETLVRQRNDWIFWSGWLNGFAFGVLIISIVAMFGWPR